MRLAVSNIAWEPAEDEAVLDVLRRHGVDAVELAPTKRWPRLDAVPLDEVRAYRRSWNERGFEVAALQSLLFGRPELTLFESRERREAAVAYLRATIDLAAELGASALVFGSPRNRLRGGRPLGEVWSEAVELFGILGTHAEQRGVSFCIEPNPSLYGADFILRAEDGLRLVKEVGSKGFGLHLDLGCMQVAEDDKVASLRAGFDVLRHCHVSAPNLAPVDDQLPEDHGRALQELQRLGYGRFVSIEMLSRGAPAAPLVEKAVSTVRRWLSA